MMLTPLAIAKPGAEKSNDKFDYFQLVVSGAGDGIFEKEVIAPAGGAPPNSIHRMGQGWVTGEVVELTVGTDTYDKTTNPYSIDYTTTFDIIIFLNDEGVAEKYTVKLIDVVTVYDEGLEIGTLVLKIESVVGFTDGTASSYSGTVCGYGTGDLSGVHISAVDLGFVPAESGFVRVGTIIGWPL